MKRQLTNKEQQLLQKIRQSITANPFSRQRAVADSRISDLAPNTKPEKLLNAAIEVARKSGHEFIHSNRADVSLFEGRAMSASLNRVSAVSCSPAVMNRIQTAADHINTIASSGRSTRATGAWHNLPGGTATICMESTTPISKWPKRQGLTEERSKNT